MYFCMHHKGDVGLMESDVARQMAHVYACPVVLVGTHTLRTRTDASAFPTISKLLPESTTMFPQPYTIFGCT
jgi:hypothetical protein